MVRVKVIRQFADKYTGEICKPGKELDLPNERYKDVQRFVEEVGESKKVVKKKK